MKEESIMKVWKKIGLTAAIAAGFGMAAGVGTSSVISTQNTSTQKTATANATQTAAKTEENTSSKSSTNSSSSTSKSSSDLKNTETASNSGDLSISEIASNTMPAMVAITNTSVQEVQNYFGGYGFGGNGSGQSAESVSKGTGVIMDEDDNYIYIATNAHVISDADQLSVAFVDDSAASAEVVGSDTTNDLAVIRVKKSDLDSDTLGKIKVITIGSSDDTEVGEQVVAIGNALGYGQSVSSGIISAKDRTITTQDETTGQTNETKGLLQTDAAINPGNSGGALLNMKGELIGINSAKYADESVEGMGYAIPISYAEPILEKLEKGESTTATATSNSEGSGDAYLGVSGMTVSSEYAQYYGIPEGVYVSAVEDGSAADKAGIEEGDIITAVGKTQVTSTTELKQALSSYNSGDKATLTVSRQASVSDALNGNFGSSNYQSGTVTVTFGSSKSSSSKSGSSSSNGSSESGDSSDDSKTQETSYIE